ncbi:hypothetical protein SAMN05216281_11961 [Cryobacterium luteum]|nr:hypothetical protein SAMN05216281_11961 [Cryobacterium luteum]
MQLLAFFVPTQGRRELVSIWKRILFGRRQGVICVCGHGQGRAGTTKRVANRVIVSIAADEYADSGRMGLPTEPFIHQRDVEPELASMLGLEFAGLQFDDHITQLVDVEEEQIEVMPISA